MNYMLLALFLATLLSLGSVSHSGGILGVLNPESTKPTSKDGCEDKNKLGYYGWSKGCRCNSHLTDRLDEALESIGRKLKRSYKLGVELLQEYQFTGGQVKRFRNFERKGHYRCALTRKSARIYLQINFSNLVGSYNVSVDDEILYDFQEGCGSDLYDIIGYVNNYALRFCFEDVTVNIVLSHEFGSKGLAVEGFYLSDDEIIIQNDDIDSESFKPYFIPAAEHALQGLPFCGIEKVFAEKFKKLKFNKNMLNFSPPKQTSRKPKKKSDEEDDDGAEDE